jgi:hypothetical protein
VLPPSLPPSRPPPRLLQIEREKRLVTFTYPLPPSLPPSLHSFSGSSWKKRRGASREYLRRLFRREGGWEEEEGREEGREEQEEEEEEEEEEEGREEEVTHLWYHGWRDFSIPAREDDEVVLGLAREAAERIR